jgi:hypothetical protein
VTDPVATTAEPAPAPADRQGLRWWKEALFAVGVYGVYSIVRNQFGSAGGDPGPAFGHALDVIDIEKAIHLYIEPHLQSWYLDLPAHGLIRLWNVYYGIAHFLVTFIAFVWLYRRDPGRHRLLRNTLGITTCLAVVGFATFSLMPPRLLDDPGEYGGCQVYAPQATDGWEHGDPVPTACHEYGFVDTVAVYGGWISFGNDGYKDVSNQYAAMPSMHIGWATWTAIVLVPLVRRRWARVLVIAYPLITLACIILTANHYWIDGVGGLACLALGYLAARLVTRSPGRPDLAPIPA